MRRRYNVVFGGATGRWGRFRVWRWEMKLRSSIVVDAGDELVGGVYTRRGGECPKPELWVEAQKEKRLVGGEKKWAEDRSGAFAFCRCRCRSPFLYSL